MSSQCFLSEDCCGSLMKPCCEKAQLVRNETRMTLSTSELSNLYRTIAQRTKNAKYMLKAVPASTSSGNERVGSCRLKLKSVGLKIAG
jgi:hypothetical protein